MICHDADVDGDAIPLALDYSDELLLSQHQLTKASEDIVVSKIIKHLQDADILYPLFLLEILLKKSKNLQKIHGSNNKGIQNIVQSIVKKSKNLIVKMEKKRWLKILSLLQELCEKVNVQDYLSKDVEAMTPDEDLKTPLNQQFTTKIFETILHLQKEIMKEKSFIKTFRSIHKNSQGSTLNQPFGLFDGMYPDNYCQLLSAISDSFKNLENKILHDRRPLSSDGESIKTSESAFRQKPMTLSKEYIKSLSPVGATELVKQQITEQSSSIRLLLNAGRGPISRELKEVKNLVAEKLESLGSILSSGYFGKSESRPKEREISNTVLC